MNVTAGDAVARALAIGPDSSVAIRGSSCILSTESRLTCPLPRRRSTSRRGGG
jgi:hypothetical protein